MMDEALAGQIRPLDPEPPTPNLISIPSTTWPRPALRLPFAKAHPDFQKTLKVIWILELSKLAQNRLSPKTRPAGIKASNRVGPREN